MTEDQAMMRCRRLFGEETMAVHGGVWRLRQRERPGKLERVLAAVELDVREGKPIRHRGAYATFLWNMFAD